MYVAVTNAELAARWRKRADRLDEYAAGCRAEGYVSGREGAEEAEEAALYYRLAADAIEQDDLRAIDLVGDARVRDNL